MGSSPQSGGQALTRKTSPKRRRLRYEHRVSLYSFLVALPGIIVATGISVAFALLAYAYVEKPLLTANRRLAFIRRPRGSPQPAA